MKKEWSKSVFAENLKRCIERTGKTQREVAEAAGVSAPTLSDWINAKKFPRIDKIQKLADYFGILKSDLIESKDDEAPTQQDERTAEIVRLFTSLSPEQQETAIQVLRGLLAVQKTGRGSQEKAD